MSWPERPPKKHYLRTANQWMRRHPRWTQAIAMLVAFLLLWYWSVHILGADEIKPTPIAPAAQHHVAQLISTVPLNGGVDAGCHLVAIPPSAWCHVGLQPANAKQLADFVFWEIATGVNLAVLLSTLAGLLCAPSIFAGPALIVCVLGIAAVAANGFAKLSNAANQQRCFDYHWQFTIGYTYGIGTSTYGGAHWRSPIWWPPWNMFIAQWNKNDSCAVNVTTPASRYFFGNHCWDYLSPGIPLWAKFDAYSSWNCQTWLNVI